MKFPWANVVLLLLLVVQLVTGYAGFVNGRDALRWILWLHSIGAYALLVIFYWKGAVILDALQRKRIWTRDRILFVLTLVLLLGVMVLALAWSYAGPIYWLGFSLLSLHIYLAIPVMVLMGYHAWRLRFIFRLPEAISRKTFMGTAVAATLGAMLWQGAVMTKARAGWPGALRRFTGSYERGSFTGLFPAVSWIADNPPPVDVLTWRLRIDGVVGQPVMLDYAQVLEMAGDEITAVLDCTGGWYTEQVWRGVSLGRLLALAGIGEAAASVTVTAVSGYQRRFTVAEANHYLLAVAIMVDGVERPLRHGNGFPLRLVAPDQRGVNWVKWITHIRVNDTGKWLQLPLPLR